MEFGNCEGFWGHSTRSLENARDFGAPVCGVWKLRDFEAT